MQKHDKYRVNAAVIPSIGVALLPKLACPACWPAYAGLLSSVGLGFIDYTPYLLPMTILFVCVAIIALVYNARKRHSYVPLALGIGAGICILVGKFTLESDAIMYAGVALLVIASIWNTWPQKTTKHPNCKACG